ncbi:MAG: 50S ribosomal protein L29 [Candidatus Moranbacteria bacterium]|nr:50S ribosomal protein L29 [Candidatus Moranbacteria bacterium]
MTIQELREKECAELERILGEKRSTLNHDQFLRRARQSDKKVSSQSSLRREIALICQVMSEKACV